jgi:catechol 2,3-dioxygenase-like lactoylglutathione lyase family enzyme
MKFVCPLITVKDIEKARYFYEKLLGQVVKYDFGENITFKGDFAIHLKEHFDLLINIESKHSIISKSNNFELYFETDEDIINIQIALKEENIEFIHNVFEQPWGQRVFRVYDYDGHIVEIGEPMETVVIRFYKEGKTIEEITKKTSLDRAFIETLIETINV